MVFKGETDMKEKNIHVHFSDFFGIPKDTLDQHGAFDVSLINDLPLFIDPFLLFNSKKLEYQKLHDEILNYLRFLRDKSLNGPIREGLLVDWFTFPEVKQNWFGYSQKGNSGSGLGQDFARNLHRNLNTVFANFGNEQISRSSHLEKLTLIDGGVGRDNISDFTTNLIKYYLLEYTQQFARSHLPSKLRKHVHIAKVSFNYTTESWVPGYYELPFIMNDYVILTPKDMLTKDETWINRSALINEFGQIVDSVPNEQLRAKLNNYLLKNLPGNATQKERTEVITAIVRDYPVLLEYFIRKKEEDGDLAVAVSDSNVEETESLFVKQLHDFVRNLASQTDFYSTQHDARQRIMYLKDVVENKGGHRLFYINGQPLRKEFDLHILYRLTWFGTPADVSTEVNDGRGPADFKVSVGANDKTLIEFKLATNPQLERNLQKQVEIYKKASDAHSALKVIFFFTAAEHSKVKAILQKLEMQADPNIILVDARADNKPSASKA